MSKPTKTKNVQDCLKACTGVDIRIYVNRLFLNYLSKACVAVNWKKKKCYRLSSVRGLKKKKGWTAAECA